jgi:hypothetical protein
VTDYRQLDDLIEAVTVDCYNDAERATAFYTAFTEDSRFPATASLLDSPVTVIGIDIDQDGVSLVARCVRGETEQWLSLIDVEFPEDTPVAWLHAAYRRDRGLTPYPYEMPVGWRPDWLL